MASAESWLQSAGDHGGTLRSEAFARSWMDGAERLSGASSDAGFAEAGARQAVANGGGRRHTLNREQTHPRGLLHEKCTVRLFKKVVVFFFLKLHHSESIFDVFTVVLNSNLCFPKNLNRPGRADTIGRIPELPLGSHQPQDPNVLAIL